MKTYILVLVLFLLAFAGLSVGLLFKRKGLRGSCRPDSNAGRDCQCNEKAGTVGLIRSGRKTLVDNCHQKDKKDHSVN